MNRYRAVHESPYGKDETCTVVADSKSEAIRILSDEIRTNEEYYEILSMEKIC